MARKDDPVFNVKFVQLVENQPCLWNYTHPGYSKKEEVQKAWQHVANEIKDTVRNSRERWRTIRSSFLRSLKLARTQTGRGKRKYYLSKYLQFLIPYTKSRACHKQLPLAGQPPNPNPNPSSNLNANSNSNSSPSAGGMVLRKPSTSTTTAAAAATYLTRIGQMRLLEQHHHQQQQQQEEDTKDSNGSHEDEEEAAESHDEQDDHQPQEAAAGLSPLRLQAIKVEHQQHQQQGTDKIVAAAVGAQHSLVTLPVSMAAALRSNMDWTMAEWLKGSANQLHYNNNTGSTSNNNSNNNNNNNSSSSNCNNLTATPPGASTPAPAAVAAPASAASTPGLTLAQPDADYSFLISLHPYLKEMSGKQNRRFRQKVVGLIDNVLDNLDV
ncbi:uncharacterized protein DDB_G0286175 [Drosophila navojoa]|uniref:uncharacterized protein DDB_G0286175 n=1 Tax=Drosophila navojoa TaxID=7232 RepID=UPI0011BF8CF6|nr:uncharacterized protein DDB_G0286175 [Drosophila navojoa]